MAVMTVVPMARGVTTFEATEATLGSDDVKIHGADEVDVGGLRLKLLTLSFMIEISLNVPRTGAIATIVKFIVPIAIFQFGVLPCVALMRTFPGALNVTLLPTTNAIFEFVDVKLQAPSDVEVGGISVNVLCVMTIDREENTPRTGVPWLTRT